MEIQCESEGNALETGCESEGNALEIKCETNGKTQKSRCGSEEDALKIKCGSKGNCVEIIFESQENAMAIQSMEAGGRPGRPGGGGPARARVTHNQEIGVKFQRIEAITSPNDDNQKKNT